jgi:hypothetical protein
LVLCVKRLFPAGTFTHTFSLGDFGRADNPYNLCPCVWTMRIGARTLMLEAKGQGNPTELLSVQGSTLRVRDKPGSLARICATEATGTYRWRVSDGHLDLALVKDSCRDRAAVMGHRGWQRR